MSPDANQSAVRPRVGYYRWVICALLFFAATINYIDRQVIGILTVIHLLAPRLRPAGV